MPPKKLTTAAPKKASGAPAHANYKDMIKDAILTLKERNGSSRQAIKKYIKANNNLGDITDNMFTAHFNRALKSGQESGDFEFPKGVSGRVKLAKKDAAKKPATAKKASPPPTKEVKKPAAKSATKKSSTTKAAPKKAAVLKEKKAATKAAPKKAAAKPKANASKPRKAATAAPAVEDKPAVVLGKTKSGRVTKTKAPVAPAKTARKPAAKKAAPKKSTPKKSATPKKAEA